MREVVRHRGSVAALPVFDDGRVLLVRQYRYPVDERVWELPAGRLDPGETPRRARGASWRKKSASAPRPSIRSRSSHDARLLRRAHVPLPGQWPHLRALPARRGRADRDGDVHPAEARAMIARGEVREGKTLVALLLEGERRAGGSPPRRTLQLPCVRSPTRKGVEATRLRKVRTPCRRPHLCSSRRVSAEARSRPGSSSLVWVGRMTSIVNGMTETMVRAPHNHNGPAPCNHRPTPRALRSARGSPASPSPARSWAPLCCRDLCGHASRAGSQQRDVDGSAGEQGARQHCDRADNYTHSRSLSASASSGRLAAVSRAPFDLGRRSGLGP